LKTYNIKYRSVKELNEFIVHNKIDKQKSILLQIFTGVCNVMFIERLISDIKTLIPHIKILGSTTAGEICNGVAYTNSTILSFTLFEKTEVATYYTEIGEESYQSAKNLIKQFDPNRSAKIALSFADGLNINGDEYIDAFRDYDPKLVIAGGLSGDNSKFEQTIVFTEEKILTKGAVIALLFNENLQVTTNASFGWEHIGKTMTITKVDKNVVYEIDGQKAVDIYAKYLGKDIANELPHVGIEFPLIIKRNNLSIPRAIMGKGEDGSLSFAGNFLEGDKVTFGYGNIQAILRYAHTFYDDPDIQESESIFVYSCMARLRLLNENINTELAMLQQIQSISGFFTYGEFYFNQKDTKHELLNQTMTIVGLSEGTQERKVPLCKNNTFIKERRKQNLTLKAFSHLISETSKELEEANRSLQGKVKQEVEKNRQKDQAMLHQSKLAQMGEMISMIAHQWRQPLAAISSLSQGLHIKAKLGTLDQETILDLSSTITEHTQYLSTTIDDFREFFRPKKEKKDTTYTEIIESVLKIIETSILTKNIKIIKDFQLEKNFYSYPNEIKQVVLNLLKNAEDALIENEVQNPYIKIKTYQDDHFYILEISDNGGGIDEDIKDKIFDPYFSTKTEKNGTGLGLYMSKTIIEEHCNGTLDIKNTHDGALFTIKIEKVGENV